MKLTVLLVIAVTSLNPGNSTQKQAEASTDFAISEDLSAGEIPKAYEKHPAFAVIRNCN